MSVPDSSKFVLSADDLNHLRAVALARAKRRANRNGIHDMLTIEHIANEALTVLLRRIFAGAVVNNTIAAYTKWLKTAIKYRVQDELRRRGRTEPREVKLSRKTAARTNTSLQAENRTLLKQILAALSGWPKWIPAVITGLVTIDEVAVAYNMPRSSVWAMKNRAIAYVKRTIMK